MIGNTNTHRLHYPNCRAVKTIAAKNIVYNAQDEGFPVYCHWCGGVGTEKTTQLHLEDFKMEENKICADEIYAKLFDKVGCLECKSKLGRIEMYEHSGGTDVRGEEGKWWVTEITTILS